MHVSPGLPFGVHVCVGRSQWPVCAQSLSELHVVVQLVETPSHAYGAHEGVPISRALCTPHVPVPDWHTLHCPEHALSQHTPSTQKPVWQTPHPAWRQLAPALESQPAPCAFFGVQFAVALQ